MDRFLRKGILDKSLDVCGGDDEGEVAGEVYADDIEEEEEEDGEDEYGFNVEESESDDFDSILDKFCPGVFIISPKNFSVRLRPSSWLTPAKATTILSGRKKVLR